MIIVPPGTAHQCDIPHLVKALIRRPAGIPPAAEAELPRYPRMSVHLLRLSAQEHETPRSGTLDKELQAYSRLQLEPALLIEGLCALPKLLGLLDKKGCKRWTLMMHGTTVYSHFGPKPAIIWRGEDGMLCLDFARMLPGYPDAPAFRIGIRPLHA